MIRSLHIENFRGFKSLDVPDLGRVNVIVGRNDCGKTSLLGAAAFARGGCGLLLQWARYLGHVQLDRTDFERVFRPMFHGGSPTTPFSFRVTHDDGTVQSSSFTATKTARGWGLPMSAAYEGRTNGAVSAQFLDGATRVEVTGGVTGAPPPDDHVGGWCGPYPDSEEELARALALRYTTGALPAVVGNMRIAFPHVEAVDLVGDHIYARLSGHDLPLPISVLGDGARRILDFAAVTVATETVYIDEIENGLHWSVLRHAWRLLRESSAQVFATTHRDEAIRLACEVFVEANDDGLRVIRLDRVGDTHKAVIYTAAQALAALDADLEIRG